MHNVCRKIGCELMNTLPHDRKSSSAWPTSEQIDDLQNFKYVTKPLKFSICDNLTFMFNASTTTQLLSYCFNLKTRSIAAHQ